MRRSPMPVTLCLMAALTIGCSDGDDSDDFDRQAPPADEGIHGFANGCYAVESFDGHKTLRYLQKAQSGEGFEFSADDMDTAARFHMRPSDLETYLFYDRDKGYLAAEAAADGAEFQFTRPVSLQSKVDLLDETFKSPAEWRLQSSSRDSARYQLKHYATGRYLTRSGLTEDVSKAAIITLHPQEGCIAFPELSIDATGTVALRKWEDGDVYGIAEVHSHMMADSGFGGGGLYHGAPFHRLGVERALPDCTRSHGPEGRRDLMGFFYDGKTGFDIAKLLPVVSSGEFTEFNHHTDGYPTFKEWPNSWRRSTHQTMYYRWLERAYLGGLRLLVQHATGNSVMCELTVGTGAQKTLYSCNDMVSVDHAIASAHALERYIDAQAGGPGKGWLRVVSSPAAARQTINQGKLAMVLGIEISNLFDCFLTPPKGFKACTEDSIRATLDDYQSRGVQAVFPVHK